MIQSLKPESGSITLFATVIMLPLLFFLLTLTLDLTQLYANRASMQRLIDEAALHGYRFLPFQSQARKAVQGYLSQLNNAAGTYESTISSDSIEIIYHGIAPFTFAAFAGKNSGIPFDLRSRVRGTVVHAALMIDSASHLAPNSPDVLWGQEGQWPAALLFTHFYPFGSGVSPRLVSQHCHNPFFSALKRSALRLFDYLTSFSKNSVGVGFFPGTLSQVDIVKDVRRPGRATTAPVTGYFNIANGPLSRNSYCLALEFEESLDSPYRLMPLSGLEEDLQVSSERLTDPHTHLVQDTALADISVRNMIWSRAIRPGAVFSSNLLLRITEQLSSGGELNPYEKRNRLAEMPVKVGIILTADLPSEGIERFPAPSVKSALSTELRRFWIMLGGDSSGSSAERGFLGRLYYVVLGGPDSRFDNHDISGLQDFFNQSLLDLGIGDLVSVRVIYSHDAEGLAQGVIRSLVLENNTAIIDG